MSNNSRVSAVQDAFVQQFHTKPEFVVRAPGRVNLIGEHTDYNEGFVFPTAIDREMIIAATPNGSDEIVAYSLDYGQTDKFKLGNISKSNEHPWADYLRGVISTLQKRQFVVGGFNAVLAGNVPQGAGLSSSAAYEVAVVTLCNEINKLSISGKDVALIAQQAENEFVGMQCGIMDQFISALGQEDAALMIDCRSLDYRAVPLKLSDRGCSIVITNSGVRRGLVDSEYNARRAECSEGVKMLSGLTGRKLNSLRDIELNEFERHAGKLSKKVMQRCRHVISENKRVLDAVSALESSDLKRFGELMNESHASLRDDFEVSCAEVDQLVELSQKHPGVLGARMTGAGFGGCTVAIMSNDAVEAFRNSVVPQYEKQTGRTAEI
ncbi:MAG: galactokinase, partial [Candidatus Melainabacteria bacterium]|nr:galactokinase [Candidatus Melainabacteria bacterium]